MDQDKKVRLAGIAYESLVNGPGIRRVFFAQGCTHNCENCFNPETHSFTEGELLDMDTLVKDVKDNPFLRGVTFSGGDPLEQADKFAYIAKNVKESGLSVWSYTGYKFEYILEHQDERKGWRELLQNLDVIVDGKFEQQMQRPGLKFRGSANQRIIDVKESLKEGKVIVLNYDEN